MGSRGGDERGRRGRERGESRGVGEGGGGRRGLTARRSLSSPPSGEAGEREGGGEDGGQRVWIRLGKVCFLLVSGCFHLTGSDPGQEYRCKMLGGFLSKVILLAFGYIYAYPAHEFYKTVELNKPEIEHLILDFSCPINSLGKIWGCCNIMGTTYVYETFFRSYISQHENDIDRNILEF
ncbi:hypothetical protein C2845_PM01G45970 [Panicum miliaceum]|uniref:Uncharacterized protein n=1 Tax=Panicum miliaceum TaxID=4540 RepID=A0A3L6TKJ5_PANMI|nr:hypothetical protein C2845_PM01G45970 [Panicum miliaceum]